MDVRAAKVVSGLEPENTNLFLIALAECASDPAYDSAAAVGRALGGEQAGSGPPALKSSGGGEAKRSSGEMTSDAKAEFSSPQHDAKDADRGKSRGGT